MLRSIRFNDEPMSDAEEVDDVGADRRLAAKLERLHPPVSQGVPELSLRFGRLSAHRASARLGGNGDVAAHPHHSLLLKHPHPAALRASTFSRKREKVALSRLRERWGEGHPNTPCTNHFACAVSRPQRPSR